MEEDISKFDRTKCLSSGHVWLKGQCKPLTLDNVMRTDLETFCEVAKGTLKNKATSMGLEGEGISRAVAKLCRFEAIHVANEKGNTKWAPNIKSMIDATGNWYLTELPKSAVACAKGDAEEIVGSYEDVKQQVLEELDDEQKEDLKNEELNLDKLIEDRFQSELEFRCMEEIWPAITQNAKECMTGFWRGEDRDNYDLGETDNLFTNENTDSVWVEEEDVEIDTSPELISGRPDIWTIMNMRDKEKQFDRGTRAVADAFDKQPTPSLQLFGNGKIEITPLNKEENFTHIDREVVKVLKTKSPTLHLNNKSLIRETTDELQMFEFFKIDADSERITLENKESTLKKWAFKHDMSLMALSFNGKKQIIIERHYPLIRKNEKPEFKLRLKEVTLL